MKRHKFQIEDQMIENLRAFNLEYQPSRLAPEFRARVPGTPY